MYLHTHGYVLQHKFDQELTLRGLLDNIFCFRVHDHIEQVTGENEGRGGGVSPLVAQHLVLVSSLPIPPPPFSPPLLPLFFAPPPPPPLP